MPLCWMKGNLPPPFLPPQAKEKSGGGNEYKGFVNPSVSGVFIPLWQRGIKGDFKIMLVKSPLAPLFQRGV